LNATPGGANKTAIIIGAIVLVVLIGGGVAAYLLLGKSSGNSNSGTVASSPAAGSPGDTAKRMVRAIEGEDWDAFRKLATGGLLRDLDEVQEVIPKIKSAGGINSIEIQREKVDGDTADVGYVIKWGNGGIRDYGMRMVRENGIWKVKDMGALEPPRSSSSSSQTNVKREIDVNVEAGFRAGDRVRVVRRAGTLKPVDTGHTSEVECDSGRTGTIIRGGDNTVVTVRWDGQQWAEYKTGNRVTLDSFVSTVHSSYLVKGSSQ
jgi:hypothetical protein